jgi:large conductance mechanosensitive channel
VIKEFKQFIMRGNLLELAVAVILALAFSAVVASLVADVVTPIIAAIFGQPDFSALVINIGDSAIKYGLFINALINFLLIALVLFLIVRTLNRLQRKEEAAPDTRDCPYCLSTIPTAATRCSACTSQVEPVGG